MVFWKSPGSAQLSSCKTLLLFSPATLSHMWARLGFLVVLLFLFATPAEAQQVQCTNAYGPVYTLRYTVPSGSYNPGANQHNSLKTNAAAAQADINKSFYTPEITTFHDKQCANGPCDNVTLGIAHRTWPLGSCVAVCNPKVNRCGIAKVMDRGPNTALGCRTIDANPALTAFLELKGREPAIYSLLSLPPKDCHTTQLPKGMKIPDLPKTETYYGTGGQQGLGTQQGLGGLQGMGGPFSPTSGLGAYGTKPPGYLPTSSSGARTSPLSPQQSSYAHYTLADPSLQTLPGNASGGLPGGTGGAAPAVPGKAAAALLVQPNPVKGGGTIVVSWASVNTAIGGCRVTVDNEEIGIGASGVKSISVSGKTGTIRTQMTCIPLIPGPEIIKGAEVTIQ